MLGDVGQGLGHREVGDRLEPGLRARSRTDVDRDRDRGAGGQRRQCRVEAAVGEHGRVDPAGHAAQVGDGLLGRGVGAVQDLLHPRRVGPQALLGHTQIHRDGHQALLGAVVQVPLDAAPLRLHGVHGALPGLGQGVDPGAQLGHPDRRVGADGEPREGDVDRAEHPRQERQHEQQQHPADRHRQQEQLRDGSAHHDGLRRQERGQSADRPRQQQHGDQQPAGHAPQGDQGEVEQRPPGSGVQQHPAPQRQVRGAAFHRWDPGAEEDRDAPPLRPDHAERDRQHDRQERQAHQQGTGERGAQDGQDHGQEDPGQQQVQDQVHDSAPAP